MDSFVILSIVVPILIASILSAVLIFFICTIKDGPEHAYTLINDSISTNELPNEYLNDEESLLHLAYEFDFTSLSPEEQSAYLKGEEYTQQNSPDFTLTRGKTFSRDDDKVIKEKGIGAFEFEQEYHTRRPRFFVADKTELNFHNNAEPYSTATCSLNFPLPVKNRTFSDTIYFETKVYEFDHTNLNAHFSIGLITKPYPSHIRLPGYNSFSIAYESTGNLKINKPFPTPLQQHQGENSKFNAQVLPSLKQSDVVGFGYIIPTGTIFITRNGKKVMDIMKGCFVDLYPAVGCFSTNAKFHVNLGQLGFVWIEANVRKFGFISTADQRKLWGDRGAIALPEYENVLKTDSDKILDRGEELPPRYPEEELDFFGRTVKIGSSKEITHYEQEKGESDSLKEDKECVSSSKVTNEPEELLDLRERLYEQNVTGSTSSSKPSMDSVTSINPDHTAQVTTSGLSSGENSRDTASNSPKPTQKSSSKQKSRRKSKKKKGNKKTRK